MSQGDKTIRTTMAIIVGAHNCPTCLNPKRSALHRELCLIGAGRPPI